MPLLEILAEKAPPAAVGTTSATPPAMDTALRDHLRELDRLLRQVDSIADPAARDATTKIIRALMEFHGAGMGALFDRIAESEAGVPLIEKLAEDNLVASLMLVHGLHPKDLQTRVEEALEKARPYLASHGGNVELRSISEEGIVKLQMQGSCHGCPSSSITLKTAIEDAIYEKAPDVGGIEVEQDANGESTSGAAAGFVPAEQLRRH